MASGRMELSPETIAARDEAKKLRDAKTLEEVKADRRRERRERERLIFEREIRG